MSKKNIGLGFKPKVHFLVKTRKPLFRAGYSKANAMQWESTKTPGACATIPPSTCANKNCFRGRYNAAPCKDVHAYHQIYKVALGYARKVTMHGQARSGRLMHANVSCVKITITVERKQHSLTISKNLNSIGNSIANTLIYTCY